MLEKKHSVSVAICTRDRPDDLVRCLKSIEHQAIQPNHIIIVSGSDESCPKNIIQLFAHLPLQRIECYENNISTSRNAAIACTQDDLVLFIDDDAIAHEGWIESYINIFASNPDLWAAGGSVFDSRTDPHQYEFHHGMLSSFGRQSEVNSTIDQLIQRGYKKTVKGCNFAIRRDKVVQMGGFDPFFRFAFDEADLVYSIYDSGGSIAHCDGAIVDHAHTPGHYRQSGVMDHDWRVEYASHTLFMLKHTPATMRRRGRHAITLRHIKLIVTACICVLKAQVSIRRAFQSLIDARRGIRDAQSEFQSRTTNMKTVPGGSK